MQHGDTLLFLVDPVDDTIDVSVVAIEQMAQILSLGRGRAPGGVFLKAENGRLQAIEPCMRLRRSSGVDPAVESAKIALGSIGQLNAVCHTPRAVR